MITKKAGVDYEYDGMALTIEPTEVSDNYDSVGKSSKTHDDGWTIEGEVKEDYYYWVNEFHAHHPKLGHVWGDFESEIYADSEEAFADFYSKHSPKSWDYGDI